MKRKPAKSKPLPVVTVTGPGDRDHAEMMALLRRAVRLKGSIVRSWSVFDRMVTIDIYDDRPRRSR